MAAKTFSTYSKTYQDSHLANNLTYSLANNVLTLNLIANDGTTVLATRDITLSGRLSDVTYDNSTKVLTVSYADGTTAATYTLKNFVTGSFSKVTGSGNEGKLNVTIKDVATDTNIFSDTVENVVFTTDSQTLTNKTIDADSNTISNIDTTEFKTGIIQTSVRAAASAVDTALATEKAVRTELDLLVKDVNINGGTSLVTNQVASIPLGSDSAFGAVKVDNATITAASGVIKAATATTSALGVSKPDDSSLTIDANGVLSVKQQYTITKQASAEEGFFATYQLFKDSTAVGDKINIPKDYLVKSATIGTVTAADKDKTTTPPGKFSDETKYGNFLVGDKYLDLVINVKSGTATDEHIYILVKDMGNVYTAGSGINISDSNVISVKGNSAKAIEVDSTNGVGVVAGDGITVAATGVAVKGDNTKAIKVDSSAGVQVIHNSNKALEIDSTNGLGVVVDSAKAIVIDGTSHGLALNVGNGLEISSNAVKAKANASKAIEVISDGIGIVAGDGISVSSSGITVSVDATTLEIDGTSKKVQVKDGGISATKLAADAVETDKIKNANVTTAKVADGAITAAKLAADAVETDKIKNANVTLAKLNDDVATKVYEVTQDTDGVITFTQLRESAS